MKRTNLVEIYFMKFKTTLLFSLFLSLASASVYAATGAQLPRPLTLDNALEYALQHNPQLKITKEELHNQQGILVQSASRMLPSIVASANASEYQYATLPTAGASTAGGKKAWSADVTLTQTLFAGGGIWHGTRASFASMQAAKARLTSAIEATVYAVKQSFYQVIVDRQIILVHDENIKVLEEQLKNVQARHSAGVASDFEVLQAQVALANEKPLLIRAQNDYRVAVESLRAQLGAPSRTELAAEDIQGELSPPALTVELEKLLESSERHRADIVAAHKDAQAAALNVWATGSQYLPKVQAFAGYDWVKNATTSNIHQYEDGWVVGVQGSWTLFDGFGREGQMYSAIAKRRQAAAAELQTRLGVSVDVRQAFSGFEQSKEILLSAQTVVDQAAESLRMAKARYGAGSSTQLDVLQSQSALSQARLTLLQAQYDMIVAVARLEQVTGSHEWEVKVEEKK